MSDKAVADEHFEHTWGSNTETNPPQPSSCYWRAVQPHVERLPLCKWDACDELDYNLHINVTVALADQTAPACIDTW